MFESGSAAGPGRLRESSSHLQQAAGLGQSRRDRRRARGAGTAGALAAAAGWKNAFDALPDELVQRIMSFVEVTEAWERARLQQVNRRFRQLVRGVHWEELRLEPPAAGAHGQRMHMELVRLQLAMTDRDRTVARCEHMERYVALLDRAAARIRSGAMCGVKHLAIAIVSAELETATGQAAENHDQNYRTLVELIITAGVSVASLLAAFSTAPKPLERVDLVRGRVSVVGFVRSLFAWPNEAQQRAARVRLSFLSEKDLFSSCACALAPAMGLRHLSIEAAAEVPVFPEGVELEGAPAAVLFPSLRELNLTRALYAISDTAALVRACPNLKKLHLERIDSHAHTLEPLAGLESLEELYLDFDPLDPYDLDRVEAEDLSEPLAALAASCSKLRSLWLMSEEANMFVSAAEFAAVLQISGLEQLAIAVQYDVAVSGLSSLQHLTFLDLVLSDKYRALGTAAATLQRASALQTLHLQFSVEEGEDVRVAAVELLQAARPTLTKIDLCLDLRAPSAAVPVAILRQLAAGGPKLQHIFLNSSIARTQEIVAFRELIPLCEDAGRRPPTIELCISPSDECDSSVLRLADRVVTNWFGRYSNVTISSFQLD